MKSLVMIILCLLFSNAYALTNPNFDCNKATKQVEKLICGDQKLAELDRKIADLTKQIVHTSSPENAAAFLHYQRSWLKSRDEACKYGCSKDDIYQVLQNRVDDLNNTINWYQNPLWVNFSSEWNEGSVQFFGGDKKNYFAKLDEMYKYKLPNDSYDFEFTPPNNNTMTDDQENKWQIDNSVPIRSCADLAKEKQNLKQYTLNVIDESGNKFCITTDCYIAMSSFVRDCQIIDELREVKPATEESFKSFSFDPKSIPDINLYHGDDVGSIIDFIDFSKSPKTQFKQYVPYKIKATLNEINGNDINKTSTKVTVIGRGDFMGDGKEQLLINYSTSDDNANPSTVDDYYLLEKNSDGRFKIVKEFDSESVTGN